MRARTLVVLLCTIACIGGLVHGAPPALRDPPPSAVIWYRYDPGVLPAPEAPPPNALQRNLLLSAIRAGLSSGLFGNKTPAHALQSLLAAGELGDTPHVAAILDFGAHRRPDGTGMEIEHLQAAIAIDDATRVPAYLRTIRALALATSGANPEALSQSSVSIPGVGEAVRLTSSAWPGWMALSWTVHDGRFILGIGRGALEGWFARPSGAGELDPAWAAHRAAVRSARPARAAFLEAYVDIAALRSAFPLAFASGRTPRMLAALDLRDATSVMLHAAALGPSAPGDSPGSSGAPQAPLIALDWTAAASGGVAWRPLSASSWPGEEATGLAPPPGTSILVASVDWPSALQWALDVYAATVQSEDLPEFEAARGRWEAAHADSVDSLLASLRPWLVLSDVPPPLLPIPGLATIFVAADRGPETTKALEGLFEDLIAPFSDRLIVAGPSGARTWALKLDDRGVVRLPAWGFVSTPDGPLLVGGWGLPVVHENRARLVTPR